MKLDRREFDVVLAGLRALQEVEPSDEVWGLATDGGAFRCALEGRDQCPVRAP